MRRLKILWVLACLAHGVPAAVTLPARDAGTFVQRKILADVGMTLVSTGTFSFVRREGFVWKTLHPVTSVFTATPTNWTFSAAGAVTAHPIDGRIETFEDVFRVREMQAMVTAVETRGTPPESVTVRFKNGDRLEIALARAPASAGK